MKYLIFDPSYFSNLLFLQDFRGAVESAVGDDEEPLFENVKLDEIMSTLPQAYHLHNEILNELETRIKQW